MKKIYKTKLFTHIWLIIQYFIVSVMLSMLSVSLILFIFKVATGRVTDTSLIEINKLFFITATFSIIGGAVYNSGKKIVLENGLLIYHSFFKEKYRLDIKKNKVYLEMKPKKTRKGYYLKRNLYFKENGIKKNIKCNWLSADQCNGLTVAMEKYKYISSKNDDFKNGEIFDTEKTSGKFFVGGQKMVSQRIKKVWIITIIFVFGILAVSLIMIFMIFEVFRPYFFLILYFFLIIFGYFIIGIFVPVIVFLFFLKKRIEKYTPEYIIVKSKDISVDNANFSKYDVNRIEMTRKEATLYSLFNDRKMIIHSKEEKYMFILGNLPPYLKEFPLLRPSTVYEDYDLLYDSIMKWCFENNIEFISTGR